MKATSAAVIACVLGYIVHGHATEAQTETVLYSFCSQQNCPDGRNPLAGVTDVNGTLYGTTPGGGAGSHSGPGGTAFSLDPKTGAETVLYSFCSRQNCADGGYPVAGLLNVNGTLYGTTLSGGSANFCGDGCGTLFSLDPGTGIETVLYSFCNQPGCKDGYYPASGLIDVRGALYGTTQDGGAYGNYGTVFALDPTTGEEETRYSFKNNLNDGSSPEAGLIDIGGMLYGTTSAGGANGRGTVFSLKGGKEKVFALSRGSEPFAAVIGVGGTLYGTTYFGGPAEKCDNEYGCGTAFSLDPKTGAGAVLHLFGGNADGTYPAAGFVDVKGTLYGTTSKGGAYGGGTVFSIDPKTGAETVLHDFCGQLGCADGANPYAGLIDVSGTLYGTTYNGGKYGYGTVFSIAPQEPPS